METNVKTEEMSELDKLDAEYNAVLDYLWRLTPEEEGYKASVDALKAIDGRREALGGNEVVNERVSYERSMSELKLKYEENDKEREHSLKNRELDLREKELDIRRDELELAKIKEEHEQERAEASNKNAKTSIFCYAMVGLAGVLTTAGVTLAACDTEQTRVLSTRIKDVGHSGVKVCMDIIHKLPFVK
jgi:hypothetical protein